MEHDIHFINIKIIQFHMVMFYMAKKEKKYLPPSGAGLVRYFEEETKGPKLSPQQVVIITIVLAVFCVALRFSYS
jgi:preprotein translocase subunit Sec61beta